MRYKCSQCGADTYYDGRCGDPPILICGCDEIGPTYYDGRCGDGPIVISDAKPMSKYPEELS